MLIHILINALMYAQFLKIHMETIQIQVILFVLRHALIIILNKIVPEHVFKVVLLILLAIVFHYQE